MTWEQKALGEVLQLEYGKPLAPSDRNSAGRYPAYGANGEKARTDKFYKDQPSIIVGRKGSAGEITLTERRYWPLDVTYFAEFDRQRYDLQFLYYLLATLELPRLAKGIKPGINRNEVYALPVWVPPILEQRRIAAVLDEAFEGIATAKANTEKNLFNARQLFSRVSGAVLTDPLIACRTTTLETIVESGCTLSYGIVQPGDEVAGGLPIVRPTDLMRGVIELDGLKRIDAALANSYNRTTLKGNDILLCVRGTTGTLALASSDLAGANVTRGIVPIRFDSAQLSKRSVTASCAQRRFNCKSARRPTGLHLCRSTSVTYAS